MFSDANLASPAHFPLEVPTMLELNPAADFTPRKSSRRDPWSEDEARAVLAAVGRSGLSLAAFARRHGLSDGTLYWWRAQLPAPNVEPATSMFARICTQSLPHLEVSGAGLATVDELAQLPAPQVIGPLEATNAWRSFRVPHAIRASDTYASRRHILRPTHDAHHPTRWMLTNRHPDTHLSRLQHVASMARSRAPADRP